VRLEEKVTKEYGPPQGGYRKQVHIIQEVGGSNLEIGSNGKPRDNEDLEKELRKELEKEKSSSSSITPSYYLFKMEAKVNTKSYQGDIDVVKLNHWLQQLEVYFSVHNIDEEQKIPFS
jgi:hypothetical protein